MMIILLFILLILIALIITIIILSTNANAIIGGNKKYTIQPKLTYKLFSDDNGKFCGYLRHKLNLLGWKEADNNAKYVDFAYRHYHKKLLTDKNISKKYKYIHANLKSTLNNFDKLGNKQKLATIMKHSSYIAQTEAIKDYNWKAGDIIIVREIDSQKQKGVYIVIDRPNFIQLRDMLLTEKRDAIVSKYITNPLLYKGKKFHLRMYITIFIDKNGNKKIKYMPNYIKIITAKKQYVIRDKIDYLDPEMNISGTGIGTNIITLWGVDQHKYLSESSVIFFNKCNKSIENAINSIPLDNISLYSDQNAGFYTYGGDIMLDDTGHAWILELNMDPGCLVSAWWDSAHNKFNKTFMDYLSKFYIFFIKCIYIAIFWPKFLYLNDINYVLKKMEIVLFDNEYDSYNKTWSTIQVRTDQKIIEFIKNHNFYGAYNQLSRHRAYYSSNSLNMKLVSISQDMKYFAIIPKYQNVCGRCQIAYSTRMCNSCGNCFKFAPEKIGEEIIYSNVMPRDSNIWHSTDKNRFNTKIIIFIENGEPYQFAANGPRLSSDDEYVRKRYSTCQIRMIRYKISIYINSPHCYYIDRHFRIMIRWWKCKRIIKTIYSIFIRNKKIVGLIYEIVAFLYPQITFQSMKTLCT